MKDSLLRIKFVLGYFRSTIRNQNRTRFWLRFSFVRSAAERSPNVSAGKIFRLGFVCLTLPKRQAYNFGELSGMGVEPFI